MGGLLFSNNKHQENNKEQNRVTSIGSILNSSELYLNDQIQIRAKELKVRIPREAHESF
jgi:hypothetical protein